jgi:hypothetical protein
MTPDGCSVLRIAAGCYTAIRWGGMLWVAEHLAVLLTTVE